MYYRVDKGYLIFQILGKETQSSLINLLQRSYVDKSKRSIFADLDIYTRGKAGKEIGRWLLASKRSYMHAGLISPREIINLILQANREHIQTSRCTSTMRSKDVYLVYAYTRPARCHTHTQQNNVSAYKDLRHVERGEPDRWRFTGMVRHHRIRLQVHHVCLLRCKIRKETRIWPKGRYLCRL